MDRAALIASALGALLAAAACGEDPSFVSSRGVQVYLGGHDAFLNRAQADEMEAYLVASLPAAGYAREPVERCLAVAEVRVVGSDYRCYQERRCAGEQWGRVLYVVDLGCPWTSAYLHEIAHWVQQCVKNGYDPEHREEPVWAAVGAFPRSCATAPRGTP